MKARQENVVDLGCERGTCVFVCENEQARPCLVWLLLNIVVPLPGLPRPPHWPPLCSLNKLLNTWPLHVLSLSRKTPSPAHTQTPTYTYTPYSYFPSQLLLLLPFRREVIGQPFRIRQVPLVGASLDTLHVVWIREARNWKWERRRKALSDVYFSGIHTATFLLDLYCLTYQLLLLLSLLVVLHSCFLCRTIRESWSHQETMTSFGIIIPFPFGQVPFTNYLLSTWVHTKFYYRPWVQMTLSTATFPIFASSTFIQSNQPITAIFNSVSIGTTQRA